MLFDELGIYEWDSIEPLVLADHRCRLTGVADWGHWHEQVVLGAASSFRHYEVPTSNFDDPVGFLNPKGPAKGTLEFVPTLCPFEGRSRVTPKGMGVNFRG